ncbi:hypothetical protein ACFL1K_02840 [Candidatus Omnitrophota bacterium]
MLTEITVFEAMRVAYYSMSPLFFVLGLILLFTGIEGYTRLEDVLAKELGGIKRRVIPKLEKNNYALHQVLLKGKIGIGVLCIAFSLLLFFFLR